jgi:hypothetical protein
VSSVLVQSFSQKFTPIPTAVRIAINMPSA